MSDSRVTEVRKLWQSHYVKTYDVTHMWSGKEGRRTKDLLSYADRNFEPYEVMEAIENGMIRYLGSTSKCQHEFSWFAASPHKWLFRKPDPIVVSHENYLQIKPYKTTDKNILQSLTPQERIDEIKFDLSEDPVKFMKGFANSYTWLKVGFPDLYAEVKNLIISELGADKATEYFNQAREEKLLAMP